MKPLTAKEEEAEANLFALYLLMPDNLLTPYMDKQDPGIIADIFKVERDWAVLRIALWNKDHME